MSLVEIAKVKKNEMAAPGFFRLVLEAPGIASVAKPGQFVHVRPLEYLDPLLRRPISLNNIDYRNGTITLLYQVIGRGTKIFSEKKPGETIDVMGPLGKGFSIVNDSSKTHQEILVVGGGIGVAPLLPLIKELKEAGKNITVLYGARTKDFLLDIYEVKNLGVEVNIATDDGSFGFPGFVTDLAADFINNLKKEGRTPDYFYGCGPMPMLRNLISLMDKSGISGQVSLEERMGCGVGACLACVCKIKIKSGGAWVYKKVCTDGPVFDSREVIMDE